MLTTQKYVFFAFLISIASYFGCTPEYEDADQQWSKTYSFADGPLLGALDRSDDIVDDTGRRVGDIAPETATASTDSSSCGSLPAVVNDFTYESDTGYFPENGARVWVPSEANCEGGFPLIVYLHGCMRSKSAAPHRHFGDNSRFDVLNTARELLSSGSIEPVIIAAPSQTRGNATWRGSPHSPCGPSLWGQAFEIDAFIEQVKENLPTGVNISSVSIAGHSGAGCYLRSGIFSALHEIEFYAVGSFDTCSGGVHGKQLLDSIGDSKYLSISGTMGDGRDNQNRQMNISNKVQCPSSLFEKKLKNCYSNNESTSFSYSMASPNHRRAITLGVEQFLKSFFKA
ncbi:MAG: hypothetical protein GY854_04595 [Deltaproteobacteria bacterium]|nr:hypothetical protein [Deltaproteobacteria bacterium]